MKKDCKDCKHYRDYGNFYPPLCMAKKTTSPMNFIKMERSDGWFMSRVVGSCGKSGRFFESKK